MPLVLKKERIRRVAVEGRGKVKERDSDVMNVATVNLSHVSVAELMNGANDCENDEELNGVPEGLFQKGVELYRLAPKYGPVTDKDGGREEKKDRGDRRDRRGPEPSYVFHGPIEESVRVEDVEGDQKNVESLRLLLRRLAACVLEALE